MNDKVTAYFQDVANSTKTLNEKVIDVAKLVNADEAEACVKDAKDLWNTAFYGDNNSEAQKANIDVCRTRFYFWTAVKEKVTK
jgi:hypothetical protein